MGFRFSFDGAPLAPFPRMFEGELSAYHRARLDSDDLPSTLVTRQVALGSASSTREVWFAPLDALVAGQHYTIAKSEAESWTVEVTATEGPHFARAWPRDAEPTRFAVFCSAQAERQPELTLDSGFEPISIPGRNDCFGLLVQPGSEPRFSPKRLFEAEVQTTVFNGTTPGREGELSLECRSDESRFAIGCARVADDRLFVRSPVDSYWLVQGGASHATWVSPGGAAVIAGLPPARAVELSLRIFTRWGSELAARVSVVTGDEALHVVLNEVLADATGPEPSQEWIELVNDGARPVELHGFRLSDSTFEQGVPLPEWVLAPGAYALLAREDYDRDSELDVTPPAEVAVLRLPALGARGLSNSGEPLALFSSDGLVLSRVPPLSAKPGVSWARRTPSCPDTRECFAQHVAPGASPGSENAVPE